jgi:subtilisin-like proprotein convertase family protein
VSQIESLLAEKAARTPVQRKISSQLLYARAGRFADALEATSKDPDQRITSLTQSDAKGRVLVDIKGDVSGLASQIDALGGEVVGAAASRGAARAWMPLDQIEALASSAQVRAIRPAFQAATARADRPGATDPKFRVGTRAERVAAMQAARESWSAANFSPSAPELAAGSLILTSGSRTSEGVKAHAVDRARKLHGVDGTGVRIGVLSDSDDGREQSITTGDLPAGTIAIPGQDGRPGSGEGTAMMEIVHDVAPGAEIVFATAFNGPESFAENIRRLRFEYNCDVIVDDIIYFFESPYQDDIIAQAVEDVTADGAVYVSSAGNEGNLSDGTSGTWEGDFRDAGTLATLPSGYTVHSFGDRVISNRVESAGGPVVLHWSDPGTLEAPASSNDYDLFLLDAKLRNVVLAATDLQDGAGLPFEFLGFNIPAGFRVVIARNPNAEARAIRTAVFRGELGIATAGSTYGHNSAAGALGVAAVDAADAVGGVFVPGPTTPVELFSADGPRRVFHDRNGNPITPGKLTFASAGGQVRQKPDVAAADGVQTTLPPFSGLNPFFGTSAAAPHVAGIAALIKAAVPTATSEQIRNAIKAGTFDIEAAGIDRDTGRGLVMATEALKRANAPFAAFLEQASITLTASSGDVLLPGATATMRVQLRNVGGGRASSVSAVLTSLSPNATVTQGASTYPTVFPDGTATNPTAYAFSVDPATPCGARLPFRLTVSYTGLGPNPAVIDFAIQTGRADTVFTTVAYAGAPVAIPDGNLAGVNVPLEVTGPAAISKLRFRIDGTSCSTVIGSTTVGVNHTWVGDLAFKLTSPAGTSVTLFDAPGGPNNSANNLCQTELDDAATASIQTVTLAQAPYTGVFRPASPLAAFLGQPATGTWTLNASDSTFFDTGSVRAFSIQAAGFTCTP